MTADNDLRRALESAYRESDFWEPVSDTVWEDYAARVRAALAARSEPDEELRRAHDVVCACPADDSDPDCNWRPTITEIRAALAARSEPRAEGLRDIVRSMRYDSTLKGKPDLYRDGWDAATVVLLDRLAATPPAEGLDEKRLAQLLAKAHYELVAPILMESEYQAMAQYIAREYAALAPEQPEGDDPIAWGSQQI